VPAGLTRDVLATGGRGPSTIADPTALLARYFGAVERIWEFVDAWQRGMRDEGRGMGDEG
jgi:hypothetical protein